LAMAPGIVETFLQKKIDTFVDTLVRDIMALYLAEGLKPSEGEEAHGTAKQAHA